MSPWARQPCTSTVLGLAARLLECRRLRTTLSTVTPPLVLKTLLFPTLSGDLWRQASKVLPLALTPAVGSGALKTNVDSSANTAVGYNALTSQVTRYALAGVPSSVPMWPSGLRPLLTSLAQRPGITPSTPHSAIKRSLILPTGTQISPWAIWPV